MFKEIVYIFKTLDKSSLIKVGVMVSVTIGLCILILTTVENPVIERWKEEKKTDQMYEQRKSDKQDKISTSKSDKESTNKSDKPVY